ncbi:LacI family DNA-binding transcriptional regulator [Halomonas elongata]|uniref:LacI family DNA-binding transcriptional regulator n=1 Tax=Halomonas elongata (strain ATCC 33173 / DSM 2581 / NBRC 15536 / NCIMB 2198 / 1H9) TaxID=768066 RepID=E1V5D2_HALED|nr:LacI family DNA-binding transcriptional regulator [Halomonas elongata]MDL4863916.1 LacI family DNA-binding transcriptional regulator [Halomonas elongata]RAW07477.1 transcriptional regulator CytR [Halomonas elongata]WBF16828.1 LacI family transcriptional regulator [Halomonas elongata]WPU45659.1 LacI family DNA-binding transcriptional regulator [Halomonas elongata DSM 2581]WVI70503.1 LacI family DNA-binding transcriptional regulator [Halomonas elongata]
MTNIRKVAELADVSVATVSRTLKTPDIVSPETRDRVLAAVEQAGYRPNMMAVQFRSQRTRNLVVLVPTIANTFFARVIGGIQEAAQRRGYGILLCNTLGDERTEQAYAGMVSTRQADGLIQLRAYDPFTSLNGESRPPMVNACEVLDEAPCPTVKLDNRAAARTVTEHLLSLGHRRIGMIKGPRNSPLTRDRLLGFQDALAAAGLTPDKSLWCPGDFTPPSGHRAAGDLLARTDPPTAIFCENDEMAMGAMRRIREAGLRVPEDISVAGFDDIAFASFCDPSLTTIAQPAEEFGHEAVSLLLDIIDDRDGAADRHRIMPFELVVRESTGRVV